MDTGGLVVLLLLGGCWRPPARGGYAALPGWLSRSPWGWRSQPPWRPPRSGCTSTDARRSPCWSCSPAPSPWPAAARWPPGSSCSSTAASGALARVDAPRRRGAARRRLDRRPGARRHLRLAGRGLARGAGHRARAQGPRSLPRCATRSAPAPQSASSSARSPACCGPPPAPASSGCWPDRRGGRSRARGRRSRGSPAS